MNIKISCLLQNLKSDSYSLKKCFLSKYGVMSAFFYMCCLLIFIICTDISIEYLQLIDLIVTLIIISFIDAKQHIIPNIMTISMLLSQLICIFCITKSQINGLNILVAAVLFVVLLLINKLSKEQLGMGDVKLLVVVGLVYGLSFLMYTLILSLLLMLMYSVPMLIIKKFKLSTQMPFAPFYTIGIIMYIIINLL